MILDALKKANNSLNTTTKALCNEDLKSILNIHHFGLDEALAIANNGSRFSNPITYLKFKVIDAVKDFNLSKKILGSYFKTQLIKIEDAIENPIIRKQLLEETFFKTKNDINHLKVENFADVLALHEIGMQKGSDEVITAMRTINSKLGIKQKIMNPFSGIVVNLEMQQNETHTAHGNRVLTIDEKYHDVNALHVVQLTTNNDREFKLSDDSNYNKLVSFEFTLYHELAHTSYNQVSKTTEEDRNTKEIHSDLCSIVKMMKNHDLTPQESLKLCEEVFKYRLDTAAKATYFDKNPEIREHFTELGIIQFTSVLSRNTNKIKELKDNEIGDFVETFIQEASKKELKIMPEFINRKEFVTNLLNKYFRENIGDDLHKMMDFNVYVANGKTKLFEKNPYKTKDLYNEMKKDSIYEKMKNNMIDNLMNNDNILLDIYLQNKQLEIGKDKLFIDRLIKQMPQGRELGMDVFEKFENYKKDIQALNVISQKNNEPILKVRPQ